MQMTCPEGLMIQAGGHDLKTVALISSQWQKPPSVTFEGACRANRKKALLM
jgi:hypothetical protein